MDVRGDGMVPRKKWKLHGTLGRTAWSTPDWLLGVGMKELVDVSDDPRPLMLTWRAEPTSSGPMDWHRSCREFPTLDPFFRCSLC